MRELDDSAWLFVNHCGGHSKGVLKTRGLGILESGAVP